MKRVVYISEYSTGTVRPNDGDIHIDSLATFPDENSWAQSGEWISYNPQV